MKISLLKRILFKKTSHFNQKMKKCCSVFIVIYQIVKSLSIKMQSCVLMLKHNF